MRTAYVTIVLCGLLISAIVVAMVLAAVPRSADDGDYVLAGVGNKELQVYRHRLDLRASLISGSPTLVMYSGSPTDAELAAIDAGWGEPHHWLRLPEADVSLWWPLSVCGSVLWLCIHRMRARRARGFWLPQFGRRYNQPIMKQLITFVCLLNLAFSAMALAQTTMPVAPTTRPIIQVGADGFPVGHDTPEAAACDFARAFISCDDSLFRKTCVRLYASGGTGPAAYAKFFNDTAEAIKTAKTSAHHGGPRAIGKVFAGRHLSHDGPASYGYTAFEFQDIMFVDVGVFLHDGGQSVNRTMVVKDKDGLWYVHPMPEVSPLLSEGLNDEGPSKQDFSEAYTVHDQ